MSVVHMRWGLPRRTGRELIINVRAETLAEKFPHHRLCLIPAGCFYEWDTHKQKVTFHSDELLFLAGIYLNAHDASRFAIVTIPADPVVSPCTAECLHCSKKILS